MKIVPATLDHLPAILAIYNEAIAGRNATSDLEPRTLEDRQQWFQQFNERYPIFVGLVNEEVVGYACLFKYSPKEGYRFSCENSIYIASRHHGQGYGRALLEHLIATARANEFHYMEALIFSENLASIRLHERLGFQLVGVKKEATRLDNCWRDVTILYLHL